MERIQTDNPNTQVGSKLTTNQEILLSLFVDGEANWYESYKAKRLLSASKEAQKLLKELQQTSLNLKKILSTSTEIPSNTTDVAGAFWKNVENRIQAEEKANVFLGPRKWKENEHKVAYASLTAMSLTWRSLTWSSLGAAAVAGLALFMFYSPLVDQTSPKNISPNSELVSNTLPDNNLKFVSNKKQSFSLPLDPVELDWVRSDGRVRMLQDPTEKTAIIWINRNSARLRQELQPVQGYSSLASSLSNPSGISKSDKIKIIDPHIPEAMTVMNR